jgi:hypothetical protein
MFIHILNNGTYEYRVVGATPNALTNMNSVASTYTLKGDKT